MSRGCFDCGAPIEPGQAWFCRACSRINITTPAPAEPKLPGHVADRIRPNMMFGEMVYFQGPGYLRAETLRAIADEIDRRTIKPATGGEA